ncbi:coiled-coil domain-containing protein 94 homolog [Prunus avium]|uniref:Coiled-coil domain-containing protein 94 homolog n=1 Tax=Prunus avium TaxID=42229 RepID=A0A6P5TQL7_PRUAV|nr:coiled-coil domain-containing protein 94 homolog [Prunus avium]
MAAQRKNPQIENVVMMLPSGIRCTACSTVVAKGTKLNSRKEEALGEEFWEVWKDHTFRFCFNCTQYSAEIVIRTDPQYSHLAVEAGASKFYRYIPWLPPMVEEKEKLVPYTKLAREKRGGLS